MFSSSACEPFLIRRKHLWNAVCSCGEDWGKRLTVMRTGQKASGLNALVQDMSVSLSLFPWQPKYWAGMEAGFSCDTLVIVFALLQSLLVNDIWLHCWLKYRVMILDCFDCYDSGMHISGLKLHTHTQKTGERWGNIFYIFIWSWNEYAWLDLMDLTWFRYG